jgi:mannose/cellobiose epimerase-like protein (N-acyl-D-glucosamine 2-epimerase family)/anti-anti-sigma regulatory factor
VKEEKMDQLTWTFSDTIAGYVTSADVPNKKFGLKTTDDREFEVRLTPATYAEVTRNLGEPFQDPGVPLESLLTPGRYLFAYGIFYPEKSGLIFEAKRIILTGRGPHEFRTEAAVWWIDQVRQLGEFYFHAQFPNGVVDYRNYRTHLTLEGQQIESTRQETDTISRMIYGFASAYLLTGEDRYLEAAEKGTEYLRDHMRAIDEKEGIVYWYHGMDVRGGTERKILASQFGDDFDAIPAYEQIYALAGPIQTYRVTGDPRILRDAEMTVALFDKFFKDEKKGGYFSHIDPVDFDPRAPSLGQDQARKNWNSVGDHAPAYLINLYLATGEEKYADFLVYTADTIEEHFRDYKNTPFVQEKFFEDWSQDSKWGWQQDRGVVGHNMKIAWNLLRIHHLRPNDKYVAFAREIARIMPGIGMDRQRGGWYDVMERRKAEGEDWHRYVWHDRKAWWQQEQAILAYLIMHGSLKDPEYLRLARESAAFYNAFFPDHDNGGVYFNVLATGVPYLEGTERLKGSHSMSGYHSFELCYLAAVYTNLLITRQPMDFHFKPQVGAFKDNILRVAPDLLPPGSVRIESVTINGSNWTDFDADALTVKLPAGATEDHPLERRPGWAGNPTMAPVAARELKVKVRVVPSALLFDAYLNIAADGGAELTLVGELTDAAEQAFRSQLDRLIPARPKRVVIRMENLRTMSNRSARALDFVSSKLGLDEDIVVVGANDAVKKTLQDVGIWEEFKTMDVYDADMVGQKA